MVLDDASEHEIGCETVRKVQKRNAAKISTDQPVQSVDVCMKRREATRRGLRSPNGSPGMVSNVVGSTRK